ncbi:MAG: pirin-like C-terminal cupin domain-containing protein, partial [Flavitalea sp.]
SIAHRDSAGGGGEINKGDVQWMTAGSGVLHEEFLSESFMKTGGRQHFMQLWVNLPAKYKMTSPKYQNITSAQIPNVRIDNNGSYARIIAGQFRDTTGPAETFSPVDLYDVVLVNKAIFSFNLPPDNNTMLLVNNGKINVNGQDASTGDFVVFENEGERIEINASEETNITVMSGQPLNEPIATYGPFVMNTKQEVVQAIEDFKSGKFGQLNKINN